MNMQEAFLTCLKKYAIFSGRATRSEYWWFVLAQILIIVGMTMVNETLGGLVTLLLLMPVVSVAARRLHDIGKSGWWILISAVPLIGLIFIYWAVQPSQAGANEYGAPGA